MRPAHIVPAARHRGALRALPPIRIIEVAEFARQPVTAAAGRIVADGRVMRADVAVSARAVRPDRVRLVRIARVRRRRGRNGADRGGRGFGFGRESHAQVPVDGVGRAIDGARFGQGRRVGGIVPIRGRVARVGAVCMWVHPAVIGRRSRCIQGLIEFVKDLGPPVTGGRLQAGRDWDGDFSGCERSAWTVAITILLPWALGDGFAGRSRSSSDGDRYPGLGDWAPSGRPSSVGDLPLTMDPDCDCTSTRRISACETGGGRPLLSWGLPGRNPDGV